MVSNKIIICERVLKEYSFIMMLMLLKTLLRLLSVNVLIKHKILSLNYIICCIDVVRIARRFRVTYDLQIEDRGIAK